jgi:hypothetical protein
MLVVTVKTLYAVAVVMSVLLSLSKKQKSDGYTNRKSLSEDNLKKEDNFMVVVYDPHTS